MEAPPKVRPTSVTVIAIILIVTNALGIVAGLATAGIPQVREAYEKMGVSVAVAIVWAVASNGLVIIGSIGMLKGMNWGRLLYLVLVPVSIILGWVLMGFQPFSILSVVVYILFAILLTRPQVNAYFSGEGPAASPPPTPVQE